MTSTKYLFGYEKERYGTELLIIANMRIEDAMDLLGELQPQVRYYPDEQSPEQRELRLRISDVQDGIKVWKKILELEVV